MLRLPNGKGLSAWLFFRKCTYPSLEVCNLIRAGGHGCGLHLEDSRSYETFEEELQSLQETLGEPVKAFSKHGSGRFQYGRHHYAPYEPLKYEIWGKRAGLSLFMGNREDPSEAPYTRGALTCYPSAFWLEPDWRDTQRFPLRWLLSAAQQRDIVLLLHPDNVISSLEIMREFLTVLENLRVQPARSA